MKIIRHLTLILVCILFSAGLTAAPAAAQETQKDGLTVTLTTDKDSYSAEDEITAVLTVQNTNSSSVNDVALETLIPEGCKLAEGETARTETASLKAGEELKLSVTFSQTNKEDTSSDSGNTDSDDQKTDSGKNKNTSDSGNGNSASPSDGGSSDSRNRTPSSGKSGSASTPGKTASGGGTNSSVNRTSTGGKSGILRSIINTGDSSALILWIVLLIAAAVVFVLVLILIIRKNKKNGTKLFSFFLTLILAASVWHPSTASAAEKAASIVINTQVTVDKTPLTVQGTVTYLPFSSSTDTDEDSDPADSEKFFEDKMQDEDQNGIPEGVEEVFELSDSTDDTDGDGIDDYTEIYEIGSDPSKSDSTDDQDEDGLTNYEEVITYGTSASCADTDHDTLSDYEELNTWGTDPVKADSDDDGVSDGKEIETGTDPLAADSIFHVVQTAENPEDSVEASVALDLDSQQVESLQIEPVDNELLFPSDMPGYLGQAYDFSVEGSFETAEISFTFDSSLLDQGAEPTIFYYNEAEQTLEELETYIDGNVASAVTEHFSTYILLDRVLYYGGFTWEDTWTTEDVYTAVDIALVIDDSGSMKDNDRTNRRLEVAQDLIDHLPTYSRVGIVKFNGSTALLTDQLTEDREYAKSLLTSANFYSSGGTKMYTAINNTFPLFFDSAADTLKMIVVLSDGETSDKANHRSTVASALNDTIRIYTVGLGSETSYFTKYLKPLAEDTMGNFYLASDAGALPAVYADINKRIDIETDTDGDGIPDYYEDTATAFNGKQIMMDKYNTDSDGDGLSDGEEVNITVTYSADGTMAYVKGIFISDPTSIDTDYDGVADPNEDTADRNSPNFFGSMKGHFDVAAAAYTFDYRNFFRDNTVYNASLSSASLIFSNTIYGSSSFDYDTGRSVSDAASQLQYHGFENVKSYSLKDGYDEDGITFSPFTDDDISEIAVGTHTVTYNDTEKTILAVIVRGTDSSREEWSSNADMGDADEWDNDYHQGFYLTAKRLQDFINAYVNTYLAGNDNLTYWFTGHSRGAALANMLASFWIDEGKEVYAYTYATPQTTVRADRNAAKYNSIFNIVNTSDAVTWMPLKEWKFGRFGKDIKMSIEDSYLSGTWCKATGQSQYKALNKNYISSISKKLNDNVCSSWNETHDLESNQDINDAQYSYISKRAKRFCKLTERKSVFGNHMGYTLNPSLSFVLQLGMEMLTKENDEEANHILSLLKELWNSKYGIAVAALLGDGINIFNQYGGFGLDPTHLIGDGHAPATYYVLIHNYS